MTQTIKIKRSTGSSAPSTLAQGELAYSKDGNKLYIGDPATVNTPIQINKGKIEAIDTSAGDILQIDSDNELAGVDAGSADAIVFWDDSASKLTYMTPTNLLDFASLNTTDDVTFNDLTVTGDLTITGDINSYNVTDLDVTDKTITVNSGGTEAGSDGSGLVVDRGDADDASIKWDETDGNFNFSNGIQVADQLVVSSVGRVYASDGTDVKAGFGFDSSSSTGLSYESTRNKIKFLSGGSVRAYIQTPSSNPIAPAMYVDGRTEINGRVVATGEGHSGNWKAAYDFSTSGDFNGSTFTLDADHTGTALDTGTTQIEVERGDSANAFIRYNHATSVWEHGVGSGVKKMGTITSITGGTGIDPDTADVDGAVTISLDLSELTDMTEAMVSSDEFIVLDNGADRRKAASEINLSIFNNDSGFTSNVGDITGVTLRNNSDQSPADSSIVFGTGGTNTASGTSGALTFRMAVGTIDGGTY